MKEKIQFFCQEQVIQGKFYSAPEASNALPTLLLLPGFPGNEDDVLGLGAELSLRGINTLTFNFRGTYQSEGEFSLKNSLEDIQSAFDFLQKEETVRKYRIDTNQLILGGWSFGGGIGLSYAIFHPEIAHVFSLAGTDHGDFAREYQRNETFANMVDKDFESLKYPNGPVKFADEMPIQNELIPNLSNYDLLDNAANLVDRDVLLMGGWDDYETLIEDHLIPCYRKLKELGSERVSIQIFQDNHFYEKSRLEIVETVLNWASSFQENTKEG